MYEIEEQKLSKPPEHIDLSLKLIKNLPDVIDDSANAKINVAEVDGKDLPNPLQLKGNATENVLLGSGWRMQTMNMGLPNRINRAAMKLEAARVTFSNCL